MFLMCVYTVLCKMNDDYKFWVYGCFKILLCYYQLTVFLSDACGLELYKLASPVIYCRLPIHCQICRC